MLFAQDNIMKATWVSSPIKADGKPGDWTQPLKYFDDVTKLFFGFANDDKNIYLCFQTSEEANLAKITKAGMKIYLSAKGKSKHKVTISYPLPVKDEPTSQEPSKNNDHKASQAERKNNFLVANSMMEVKGFTSRDGVIPINDSSGINAAVNWDEAGKLTYEIAIPFKELFGSDFTKEDLLNDLSLTAEVNALSRQRHGFDGGMKGMGGGRGGGGHHHNSNATQTESTPGESAVSKQAAYEKAELKQKFVLAGKN